MEYSLYTEILASIDNIFDDEAIDADLGYPEDHEYYEDESYVASLYR